MPRYDAARIEPKWQAYWDAHATFRTPDEPPAARPGPAAGGKLYALDMFPYPSGSGLHVGHPEGYTATDIVCRQARMAGKHVLHPMGWDAFGLPAEQHAIKTGVHPAVTTRRNIDTFRRQLKMLGFSYDWSREFSTTDPDYFRWTQWIFLELYDTWYDADLEWTGPDGVARVGKGRRIAELPIPEEVKRKGDEAVRRHQDARRLAYQQEAPVNWCPALGTVLANEEVIDGLSERGGHPVTRLPLRQWMLRITAYADRLAEELAPLDWTESIKALQRNWIGRSVGAEVEFKIVASDDTIRVYTTRPDTLFGATYLVLAPEHPLIDAVTTPEQAAAVAAYRDRAARKSDLERTDLAKDKSGVFTGGYAVNPVNGERIPIWTADYVLSGYGTGAIMAVPAHDERDLEFAEKFKLPVRAVVAPPDGGDGRGFTGEGTAVNSEKYDGLPTAEFKTRIIADLEAQGAGRAATNYKLRDWLFSRQHFWGEPFPLWRELDAEGEPTGLLRAVEPGDLPVRLPENFAFKPHGRPDPPLEEAPADWLYATAADGTKLKRETNSMPQWAGSCWYYLRFADPHNQERFVDPAKEDYWLPVDLYIGGAEHAVLHLLYSRFWHKVLFDRGHVKTPEPFQKLVNQGMILGDPELTAYRVETLPGQEGGSPDAPEDPAGWVSAKDVESGTDDRTGARTFVDRHSGQAVVTVALRPEMVEKQGGDFVLKSAPGIVVESRAQKMSKARGNVVNPDDVVRDYGADSLRLYEMFMGPLEATKPWQMAGVEGVYRFLARVWRTLADEGADEIRLNPAVQDAAPTEAQERLLHKTVKAVSQDIERLSFNTAISRMMEFMNAFAADAVRPRSVCEPFVLILSPFAPHLAEELWELLGHGKTLAYEPWPAWDEAKIAEASVEVPVQVNGKLRAKIRVPADADAAALEAAARADAAIVAQLEGKTVAKVVAVPGRMVNFVVR